MRAAYFAMAVWIGLLCLAISAAFSCGTLV